MDENLHDIEDIFFTELNDHEETPSDKGWDELAKRLDKESVISIKKKYNKLKKIAILLLLLLGVSIYELHTINDRNTLAKNADHDLNIKQLSSREFDKRVAARKGSVSEKSTSAKELLTGNATAPANSNKGSNKPAIKKSMQLQNFSQVAGVEKDRANEKLLPASPKKGKRTSGPFSDIQIKNTVAGGNEQEKVQNGNDVSFYQTPVFHNLQNIKSEDLVLRSKDPVPVTHSLLPLIKVDRVNTKNPGAAKSIKWLPRKLSQFSIAPFFSADLPWYHLSNDKVVAQSANAAELAKDEKHEFSYTYGFLVNYKIIGHWGIHSGINIERINIVADPGILYAQADISGNIKYRVNTSSGYAFVLPSYSANPAVGDSLYAIMAAHSLQYIGVPLAVSYTFGNSKWMFSTRAGISTNFLTRAKLETIVEKDLNNSLEITKNIQGLKTIYFNGLVGLGVNYEINKRASIVFAPSLRFALNAINKNDPVKSYPMSFGSSVGMQIRL